MRRKRREANEKQEETLATIQKDIEEAAVFGGSACNESLTTVTT